MARAAKKSTLALTSLKVVLFAGAVAAGGYFGMRTLADYKWQPLRTPAKPAPAVARPAPGASGARFVKIYVIKISGGEANLTPVEREVARDADPKTAAMKKLLSIGKEGGESAHLIPEGTQFLSLHVDRGLATLDLSREFVDNFAGGSYQESLTVGAIVRTLTQFRDVDRVQMLVEGRKVETLGGHFSLAEPLTFRSGHLETDN